MFLKNYTNHLTLQNYGYIDTVSSVEAIKISLGICVKNSNTIAEYVSILLEIMSITACNVITSLGLYITSVGYALVLSLNPIFCLSCKCRLVHKKSNMYTGYINIP